MIYKLETSTLGLRPGVWGAVNEAGFLERSSKLSMSNLGS